MPTTPASAAARLHQGLRPVAFSSHATLFHRTSSQLLATTPPVSTESGFQHLMLDGWGMGGCGDGVREKKKKKKKS